MDTKAIRDALRAFPFKPFTLRLNDGREFHIPRPEYVAVSKRVVFVIDYKTDSGLHLEPLLIASMQMEDEKNKKGKNGKGKP
jgi:hypothetical protein